MFLKFRIMRKLSFHTFTFSEDLYRSLFHPRMKSFRLSLKILETRHFIVIDEYDRIKLLHEDSFYMYRVAARKSFFEIAVSVSAIIVTLLELIKLLF